MSFNSVSNGLMKGREGKGRATGLWGRWKGSLVVKGDGEGNGK